MDLASGVNLLTADAIPESADRCSVNGMPKVAFPQPESRGSLQEPTRSRQNDGAGKSLSRCGPGVHHVVGVPDPAEYAAFTGYASKHGGVNRRITCRTRVADSGALESAIHRFAQR
jgi:hypothetical protein